jgi:2-O-(6-phospho-alpha-D-mannosyl)-D-glycerate hydrolase
MGEDEKTITYIIPHTHWDREWYVPFQYYRFRLVEIINDLLDILERNPGYKYFNLDCQTVVLEDYLEIHPENKERLGKLIQAGRLGIGPWYLLSSPWLQTGEGLIRNLQRGFKICDEFNTKPVNMGWSPDQFIHPPQMPQILKGFGIDFYAFSRGMANQFEEIPGLTCEFLWEGLDGSKVITFNLRAGYGLNAHLSPKLDQAINKMAFEQGQVMEIPWATNMQLSFAGSDHCGPDEILVEAINNWNQDEELIEELGELKFSSWQEFLPAFMEKKPQLKTIKGEIAGRKYQVAFHSVLSSYITLKQRSFSIHDYLERWSEPFNAIAVQNGMKSLSNFTDEAWKWLLRNQPHDSSWTSSVDQVEKEMDTRFDWASQIGIDVFRRSAQWIVQHLKILNNSKAIPIVIFNPHPWTRTELIEAQICNKFESSAFQLMNSDGQEITSQIKRIERGARERDRRRVYVGSHGPLGKNFYHVKFTAENIPPLGYKTFYVQERDLKADLVLPKEGLLDGNNYYLENDKLKIVVETSGKFSIMDKEMLDQPKVDESELVAGSIWAAQKDYKFKQLHVFEDYADVGDGWEFVSIPEEKPIISTGSDIKTYLIEASDFEGVIETSRVITIPNCAKEDNSSRSDEMVNIPVKTRITIEKGMHPVIKFKTTIKNLAKDHRLRLLLPTNLKTNTIAVNGHFGVLERSVIPPENKKWVRPPESIYPHHKFLSLWDEKQSRGLALFTKGIPEYDTIVNENGEITLALTLYRSTGGWGSHIGVNPAVPTPNAQLLDQDLVFEYALVPQNAKWDDKKLPDEHQIYRLAEEYYTPLQWEEEYDTYRYKIDKSERELPRIGSQLEISPANIILSSFQRIFSKDFGDKDKNLIRVYNVLPEKTEVKIKFNCDVSEIDFCDLNNKPLIEPVKFSFDKEQKELIFHLEGAKISTLLFS